VKATSEKVASGDAKSAADERLRAELAALASKDKAASENEAEQEK
jgi:hypothetical protein